MNIKMSFDKLSDSSPERQGGLLIYGLAPWDGIFAYFLFLFLALFILCYDLSVLWLTIKGLLHGHILALLWLGIIFLPRFHVVIAFFSLRIIWVGTLCQKAVKWFLAKAGINMAGPAEQGEGSNEGC